MPQKQAILAYYNLLTINVLALPCSDIIQSLFKAASNNIQFLPDKALISCKLFFI